MTDADVRWVATLSDGTTAVEHSGEYTVVPGQRKPWVRLCEFAGNNGLHLTSLRLNYKGRTIHMPREKLDRFSLQDKIRAPLSYSLHYHLEADMPIAGGPLNETHFINLVAHYPDDAVHYVQDITDGNNSWVIVTDDVATMAESPRKG